MEQQMNSQSEYILSPISLDHCDASLGISEDGWRLCLRLARNGGYFGLDWRSKLINRVEAVSLLHALEKSTGAEITQKEDA